MTIKSTTDTKPATSTRRAEDSFRREPAKPAPVTPLDRRAQRNVENLKGGNNFSSASLPKVSGVAGKQSVEVTGQRGIDAMRTIREIQEGVETRTAALEAVNERVKASETKLAEHLTHLQHTLTPSSKRVIGFTVSSQRACVAGSNRDSRVSLPTLRFSRS